MHCSQLTKSTIAAEPKKKKEKRKTQLKKRGRRNNLNPNGHNAKLKVTYFLLSGKRRTGSCLPLTASCSAGMSSVYRWPRSGRLGLVGRFEFGRTFLD